MQHSYEALDRPGGLTRAHLLSPLRHRDFRVLWAGMAVSLLGDGIFLIAMAWEAYALWNAPAALALVGIGMTVPTVVFLLAGRRRQRPSRPPARDALRRRRARRRRWRPRGARAHRLVAVLGACGACRAVRGRNRLTFETGAYFAAQEIEGFYREVVVVFTISDPAQHHHVPLLLSPFGYSTYRGS